MKFSFYLKIVWSFINTNRALNAKTTAIERYLFNMESFKQTNSIYYVRLLKELIEISQRIDAFYQADKKNRSESFEIVLKKMPNIVQIVFSVLSNEKNQQYHQKLQTSLMKISQNLRKYNINFEKEIAFFLIKSNDLIVQYEGLIILENLFREGRDTIGFEEKILKNEGNLKQLMGEYKENGREEESFEKVSEEFNKIIMNNSLKIIRFLNLK